MKRCTLCKIVTVLAGIGAINWLLVAMLDLNIVTRLLGDMTTPAKVVYVLIGLSGLMLIISMIKNVCPKCKG